MKKQPPPPDLGRAMVTKRKASFLDEWPQGNKRRASGEVKPSIAAEKPINGTASRGSTGPTKGKTANDKPTKVHKGKLQGPLMSGAELDDSSDDDAAHLLGKGYKIDAEPPVDSEDLHDELIGSGSSGFDSDPQHERATFSEDEDDSDPEEKLTAANMPGRSRRLDREQEKDAVDAQIELEEAALQTNIDGDRPGVLSNDDEDESAISRLAPDLQLLRSRMTEIVRVLDDFAKLSESGRSRADYTAQLLKDIRVYYGYLPYLTEKLYNLFSPREALAYFDANESARPVVIRTNTLRTYRRELAQSLINRGVTLEPVGKWSKVGLQIFESQVPLGATPEYLAGHYILQAASSFLPVMALAPQEYERVLDMAAAPGGKTTHIAALMKNTGCIFANDSNKSRAKSLIGNIHRLGVKNTIVCNYDAKEFPRVIGGFDRVLLDAPCSGTGVIAKDPSVKTNKTEKDFMQLPHLQKQLLLSAIDSIDHASKTGGYVVYSTCSVTIEENEQVVQYALTKRPNVKLVETGLKHGVDGFVSYMGKQFDPKMKTTKRFYPHAHNVDGFFVSKFRKMGPSPGSLTKGDALNGEKHDADAGNVDKTPIAAEDGDIEEEFESFENPEDEKLIENAKRNGQRKKGFNPRAMNRQNLVGIAREARDGKAENNTPASNGIKEAEPVAENIAQVRVATTRVT